MDPTRVGLDACSSWSNPAARHRGSAGTEPWPWLLSSWLSRGCLGTSWKNFRSSRGVSLLLSVSCICHLFSRICSPAMLSPCLLCREGAPAGCLQPCEPIMSLGTGTSSSAPPPPTLVRPPLSSDPAFNWGPHFMQVSGSRTSDLTKFSFPTQTHRQKHRSCHERGSVPPAHGGRRWWM